MPWLLAADDPRAASPPYSHALLNGSSPWPWSQLVGGGWAADCAHDVSWKVLWANDGGLQQPVMSAAALCRAVPRGARIVAFGDSMSAQIHAAWCARLVAQQWLDASRSPQEFARHQQWRLQWQDGKARTCACADGGASFTMVDAYNWALCERPKQSESGSDARSVYRCKFTSGDPRAARCATAMRANASRFNLNPIAPDELLALIARLQPTALIFNDFPHLHPFAMKLRECYTKRDKLRLDFANRLARRDVLRFWAERTARLARLLATLAPSIRSFYRTSPSAAPPPKAAGSKASNVLTMLDPNPGLAGHGSSYSHDLQQPVNDISIAAFRAAGHQILDVDFMLGTRWDARPSAHNPSSYDQLHYCLPGPIDSAVDQIVQQMYGWRDRIQ